MDLTLDELNLAVRNLKRQKTPGSSGLTAEFYQFFWDKIKDMFFNAIQFSIQSGMLHASARPGVITLVPKKNKDELFLRN